MQCEFKRKSVFCIKDKNVISGIVSTNSCVGAIVWFLLVELKMARDCFRFPSGLLAAAISGRACGANLQLVFTKLPPCFPFIAEKLPELTTVGPATTVSGYQPDSPVNVAATPAAGPPSEPEQAEIQTPGPETERPHTASPDQRGAPRTETYPTELPGTSTPVFDLYDYEQKNWVESVPVRGDALFPFPLPPLPTIRPQPDRLDISHEGEDEDLTGSGRDESSGSGSGDSSSGNGPEGSTLKPHLKGVEATSRPSDRVTPGARPAVQRQDLVPVVVVRQINISASELPADVRGSGQQPAVVFKEDSTLTPFSQLPAVPGGEESAKPPFHLIIVNVHDQNQSGELKATCTAFTPPCH